MDKTLDMLCDRLSDEIEDTVKLEKLSPASMDMLDKAVDIIKDLKEIEAMDAAVGGYSGRVYQRMQNGGSYDSYNNGSYDGSSYRRGGSQNYSRNSGAMNKLEEMYDNAQTDKEREIIRKVMTQI